MKIVTFLQVYSRRLYSVWVIGPVTLGMSGQLITSYVALNTLDNLKTLSSSDSSYRHASNMFRYPLPTFLAVGTHPILSE